jgi:hypothetical protein
VNFEHGCVRRLCIHPYAPPCSGLCIACTCIQTKHAFIHLSKGSILSRRETWTHVMCGDVVTRTAAIDAQNLQKGDQTLTITDTSIRSRTVHMGYTPTSTHADAHMHIYIYIYIYIYTHTHTHTAGRRWHPDHHQSAGTACQV